MAFSNNPVRLDRSVKYGESDALNFAFTNRDGSKNRVMSNYKLILTIRKSTFNENILLRKEVTISSTLVAMPITPSEIRGLGGEGCYWYDAWLERVDKTDYEEPLVFGRFNVIELMKKVYV